jgi:hypothetical protein
MGVPIAALLVFVCSAAVLVLEILAGRMLAPYVGITLQTYTAIIGTVLAGISVGAWGGGFVADRVDPRLVLGPLVLAGGALSILIVPIVRALGHASIGDGDVRLTTVFLTFAGFFLPSMVLSAVTPTVVKLELHDLSRTGRVVGSFSAIGTLGALVGTFVTGFILVAEFPTRTVIYSLGALLVALGIGLWLWLSRRFTAITVVLLTVTATGFGLTASAHDQCDIESAYACLYVEESSSDPNGRILWENNLVHSFVDLKDPTLLAFEYTKDFADVIKVAWTPDDNPRRPSALVRPRDRRRFQRSHCALATHDAGVRQRHRPHSSEQRRLYDECDRRWIVAIPAIGDRHLAGALPIGGRHIAFVCEELAVRELRAGRVPSRT